MGVSAVKVFDYAIAIGEGRVDERALHGRDVGLAELMHRQRPFMAVQRARTTAVGVQFFERRQQLLVAPAWQVPALEIGGTGTDGHRAVDRRTPTQHFAAQGADGVVDVARSGLVTPLEFRVGVSANDVAAGHDLGVIVRAVAMAGFEQ